MKAVHRKISLLLALVLVLGTWVLPLASCDRGNGGDTTSAEAQSTEPEVTEPAAPEGLELVRAGEGLVKVVRHMDVDTASPEVQAAINIRKQLMQLTGADIPIGDDWVKAGEKTNDNVEILVNAVNYPEVQELKSSIGYGDYAVRMIGNKIVLVGYTDEAITAAARSLTSVLGRFAVKDETTGKISIVLKAEDVEKVATVNKPLSSLPSVDGAVMMAAYDPGDACQELIFEQTTPELFTAYLAKLEQQGYKKHTARDVTGNKFATYYNSEFTLNVGYYDYNQQIRVIAEPYSKTTLIGLEADNKFTPVTTSLITMVGLGYKGSDGAMVNNGLSVLIRLTDGRFMVVDGGFNRGNDATMLVDLMKEQSRDYADKTGGIKVAAWMITHAHGDHSGMIGKHYSKFPANGIKIERFIVNFMSDSEREKAISSSSFGSNWSAGEGGAYTNVYNAASAVGADLIIAHVGQVFYFADVQMEILYTIESYGPTVTNAFNTTSVIIKMTFTDPVSKKQTVYMSTGDATGAGFRTIEKMFGDYLKADIVQVAHHGATTWGNSDGTIAAYTRMKPATLLWPIGASGFSGYSTKNYNVPLYDARNPNWKETYIAGDEGHVITLPLPYTVGSANVAPDQTKK